MGLIAAMIFAQYTSIFIERYRRRLRKQVEDLEEAARFRQTQIATMAHDIRSPVAALSGYVNLLEEADIDPKERSDLLGRIGSTAWNMDLVVSNVLDYYEAQDRRHCRGAGRAGSESTAERGRGGLRAAGAAAAIESAGRDNAACRRANSTAVISSG